MENIDMNDTGNITERLLNQLNLLAGLLLNSIRYGLNASISGLVLYNIGKILGEHLYRIYLENHVDKDSLENANDYFVRRLKEAKIVKDVMVFRAFRPDETVELICKFNGVPQFVDEERQEVRIPLAYFFYRGILVRYYELYFGEPLKVKSANFSMDDDLVCEFIIETPLGERGVEP